MEQEVGNPLTDSVAVDGDGASEAPAAAPVRELFCSPAEKCAGFTTLCQRVQKIRQRPLLILVSSGIDDDICRELYGWRSELRQAGANDDLDVLIHSPGGVLTSCYRAARLLARCTNDWEALIPVQAASGATLISLGSSKVIMPEIAAMGPIDPQVLSKRQQKFFWTERQSPLEAFQALKYLREFSLTSLDCVMGFLIQTHDVDPHLGLETSARLAMQIIEPVTSKIDPYDLGSFALDSNLATDYCRRISNPADGRKRTQRKVAFRKLVEDYPAHEFIIDLDEAEALGFSIAMPSAELDACFDEMRDQLVSIDSCVGVVSPVAGGGS